MPTDVGGGSGIFKSMDAVQMEVNNVLMSESVQASANGVCVEEVRPLPLRDCGRFIPYKVL